MTRTLGCWGCRSSAHFGRYLLAADLSFFRYADLSCARLLKQWTGKAMRTLLML